MSLEELAVDNSLCARTINNRHHGSNALVRLGIIKLDGPAERGVEVPPHLAYFCPPASSGQKLGRAKWDVLAALGRLLKSEANEVEIQVFARRICKLNPFAKEAVQLVRLWHREWGAMMRVMLDAMPTEGWTLHREKALARRVAEQVSGEVET